MSNSTTKYIYFEDPGHGWVRVLLAELKELGIADKISEYSYVREKYAYLEEDSDYTEFHKAYLAKYGKTPELLNHTQNSMSRIRTYQSYHPALVKSA